MYQRASSALAALALVLALAGLARAEVPPNFSPQTHVYVAPAGWMPPGVSEGGLAQIEAAAAKLHYPFYVVIDKGDGSTGGDARVVEIATAWLTQGFDSSGSQLFVVSYTPKFYRLHIGDRLKPNAGIDDARVKGFADIFKDRVNVGGVKDPVGAILAVMETVDPVLFDANDPAKVAAREAERAAAERARLLATSREGLATAIGHLNALLLDPTYLGGVPDAKLAEAREAIARARTIQDGDDTAAMMAMVASLQPHEKAIGNLVSDARWQETKRSLIRTGKVIFLLLLLGGIAFLLRRRRNYLAGLREEFAAGYEEWNTKVTRSMGRYVDFKDRSEVVALQTKEGRTAELLANVKKLVDEIYVATKAMELRLAVLKAKADSASFGNIGPIKEAVAGLKEAFKFNTGEVQDSLFEPATKIVSITPVDFEKVYSAKYNEAKDGWNTLIAASRAALVSAETSLKDDEYVDLVASLRTLPVAVPASYWSGHTVGTDLTLDNLRQSDPVAYVEALREAQASDAKVVKDLRRLRETIEDAYCNDHLTLPDRVQTLFGEVDPTVAFQKVVEARKALAKMVSEGASIEAIETQALHIDSLANATQRAVATVVDAFDHAGTSITDGEAQIAKVREKLDLAHARLQVAGRTHAKLPKLDEGQDLFISGERKLMEARQLLSRRQHVQAHATAKVAVDAFNRAIKAFTKVIADCDALDQQKAEYERRVAAAKAPSRGRHGYAPPVYAPTMVVIDRPVDYSAMTLEVSAYEERVRAEQRAADRRYEEAREAERRAEQARQDAEESARRAHRSSYASGSDSFGSSSGGSYSSGGDSHGSSSGSYSSGGDSW